MLLSKETCIAIKIYTLLVHASNPTSMQCSAASPTEMLKNKSIGVTDEEIKAFGFLNKINKDIIVIFGMHGSILTFRLLNRCKSGW